MNNKIKYHKWSKKENKKLFNSFKEKIDISSYNFQYYYPIMSLYFHIHNSKNAHKTIDFERRFYIQEIINKKTDDDYNSNCILDIKLFDSHKNQKYNCEAFCKSISILDLQHVINNNYNLLTNHTNSLSSPYNFNTFSKINDMNNSAYIDLFCSFFFSSITENNILPNFPIFYGSLNCIGKIKYDITEDYSYIKDDYNFNKKIRNKYTLIKYVDSDDESESNYSETNNDYIMNINKTPLVYIFSEKLIETLEELIINEGFESKYLISCLFQVSYALLYLQNNYSFTHNDLHINNIMYTKTKRAHIYYKINNQYFKVPTYGMIFKIIDFGRSILTVNNKLFYNDCFSQYGEAYGQYYYPNQVSFYKKEKLPNIIKPNYSFDLCRLSITILEVIERYNIFITNELEKLLYHMVTDSKGNNYMEHNDTFDLYINIAKYSKNANPSEILQNNIFNQYKIKKKHISSRYNVYKMN
tara:strand:- start:1275 stop:2684 length:1410 start_codon:yes stop_codon:yes gene_type:complete